MEPIKILTEIKDDRLPWHRPELLKLTVQLETGQLLKPGSCEDAVGAAGAARLPSGACPVD